MCFLRTQKEVVALLQLRENEIISKTSQEFIICFAFSIIKYLDSFPPPKKKVVSYLDF